MPASFFLPNPFAEVDRNRRNSPQASLKHDGLGMAGIIRILWGAGGPTALLGYLQFSTCWVPRRDCFERGLEAVYGLDAKKKIFSPRAPGPSPSSLNSNARHALGGGRLWWLRRGVSAFNRPRTRAKAMLNDPADPAKRFAVWHYGEQSGSRRVAGDKTFWF